jgi:peptidylprolyl isomerase
MKRIVMLLPVLGGLMLLGCVEAQGTKQEAKKDGDAKPKLTLPDVNAKEWKELKDGLKMWDVKEGTGDAVKPGATVTIHYTGWTKDGTIFDSSVKRGEMATFPLGSLIKGWQEGIPGMKPGGVRRLYIPYAMAYGEAGRPPVIPAKADLIFEIELAK